MTAGEELAHQAADAAEQQRAQVEHPGDQNDRWARDTTLMILIATASGAVASYAGLLISFHFGVASGPAIILVAGVLYLSSLLFGRVGGLVRQLFPGRHLEA